MPWFVFCPLGSVPYDICDPNNYVLVGSTPPICPSPKIYLCAIQAANNIGQPLLTFPLLCEIATAVNNRVETVNVLLRPLLTC